MATLGSFSVTSKMMTLKVAAMALIDRKFLQLAGIHYVSCMASIITASAEVLKTVSGAGSGSSSKASFGWFQPVSSLLEPDRLRQLPVQLGQFLIPWC